MIIITLNKCLTKKNEENPFKKEFKLSWRCVDGVTEIIMESGISWLSPNSIPVCCVHFHTNALVIHSNSIIK